MQTDELKSMLEPVLGIAHVASEKIVAVYNRDFTVEQKADHSPLTEADMAAHEVIEASLKSLYPDIPVLSEESSHIPFEERRQWDRYWLVDPLDGTREFVKRNGEFTVNIALIEAHEPIMGVIVVPVTGVSYYAARGNGAWKVVDGEVSEVRVRQRQPGFTIVAGSRSHASDSLVAFLERVGEHELVSMGSSLKSCLVAEGKADVYPRLGPTSEWDTAAAHCIVNEAGGSLTDTHMKPIRYNTKESLLNPSFFVSGEALYDWSQYLK